MNHRLIILGMMAVSCIAGTVYPVAADAKNQPIANVLVWVRDGRGAPVSNLTADDFAVTENGLSDRVVGVESFFSGVQVQPQIPMRSTARASPHRGQNAVDPAEALTHILILIEPMTAGPRNRAISDTLRFFSTSPARNWKVALVDDEGNYLRYTEDMDQIRAALKRLESHYAPHAQHGPWSATAQSTIRELGVLPGRHVIILISTRSAMFSSMLAGLAVASQAAMYTIDSEGPAAVVPFGGAAEFQTTEAGPIPFITGEFAAESLASTLSSMGYTNTGLGWSKQTAEETGGLSVDSVKDAFSHISADAGGYYLLSFEARARESGGTFNAISITVKRPHLHVKGPHYYLIPPDATASQMLADMKVALQSVQNQKGVSLVANSWLFPEQGTVHWGVFAADLNWLEGAPPKASRVKVYAELINDSMHGLSGAWFEEKVWPPQGAVLHWQRNGRIYPGSYTLRVIAMDTASGKVAVGTREFTARPLDVPAFRFSGIQ